MPPCTRRREIVRNHADHLLLLGRPDQPPLISSGWASNDKTEPCQSPMSFRTFSMNASGSTGFSTNISGLTSPLSRIS